jgi:hypothetical protein
MSWELYAQAFQMLINSAICEKWLELPGLKYFLLRLLMF